MLMYMFKFFDSTAHAVADRGLWDESADKWRQNGEVRYYKVRTQSLFLNFLTKKRQFHTALHPV